MSSHHIVRENQEPSLLILQAETLSSASIAPILEWSPTILVAAETLHEVLEYQIKIDGVIHLPELREECAFLLRDQEPVSFIAQKKQESTLSAGLSFLSRKGSSAVNIALSSDSDKYEEAQKLLGLQESGLEVVLLTINCKSALCSSAKYVKWLPKNEIIEIHPAREAVLISTSGFTSNLADALISEGTKLYTSGAGLVTITANNSFWITENLH